MPSMRRNTRSSYRTPPQTRTTHPNRQRARRIANVLGSAAQAAGTFTGNPMTGAAANFAIRRIGRLLSRRRRRVTGRRVVRTRQSAYYGGKVGNFKPAKKKLIVNGELTKYGLNTLGVHAKQELRTTTADGATKTECLYVGHASMPLRQTALNVWRATIKSLFNKHRIYFQDFTQDPLSFGVGVGNSIVFNYFATGVATTLTGLSYTVPSPGPSTFEAIAQYFANAFGAIANIDGIRPYEMVLTAGNGTITHLRLEGAKIHHKVTSSMKIQNRTITTIGENEADDVDNAPLTGKVFNIKGNNMLMKNTRRLLRGVGTGTSNLQNSETFLLGQALASAGDIATDGITFGQNDVVENQFARPSDIPNGYEIVNCQKVASVKINPGEIKTDIVKQTFKMTWEFLIKLLYGQTSVQKFNPKAGLCNVMVLNKMIGNSATSVDIAGEVQLDMWTAVISKTNTYTNPVIYQSEYSGFIEA